MNQLVSLLSSPLNKKKLAIVAFIFILINILQAGSISLLDDECYYYLFSQKLAWGYYDHPPMIALLIKIGYALFKSALGVRIVGILLWSASVYIIGLWSIEQAAHPIKTLWFVAVVASFSLFQSFGFLSTPDIALIFFGVLLLHAYKACVDQNKWTHYFLLGIAFAAVMYSKYHGVLIIGAIMISNPKILKNPKFYFAAIIGLLLFVPHLRWLYENDFPSIRYQMARTRGFAWSNLLDYLGSVFYVFNPFILIYFFLRYTKFKAKHKFEFLLATIPFVFIVFFLISSFKGRIEPHWIQFASVSLIYFALIDQRFYEIKSLRWLTVAIALLTLPARFIMASQHQHLEPEFQSAKPMVSTITQEADGFPLVFINSYQRASKYSFYTQKQVNAIGLVSYRNSQFDLWDNELSMNGKMVQYVMDYEAEGWKRVSLGEQDATSMIKGKFYALSKVKIQLEKPPGRLQTKQELLLDVVIENPYSFSVNLSDTSEIKLFISYFSENNAYIIHDEFHVENENKFLMPMSKTALQLKTSVRELKAGNYLIDVNIGTRLTRPLYNINRYQVVIDQTNIGYL